MLSRDQLEKSEAWSKKQLLFQMDDETKRRIFKLKFMKYSRYKCKFSPYKDVPYIKIIKQNPVWFRTKLLTNPWFSLTTVGHFFIQLDHAVEQGLFNEEENSLQSPGIVL